VGRQSFQKQSFEIAWIPSYGTLPDIAFIAASSRGPSEMAVELAQLMNESGQKDVNIVVGGPDSAMAKRVVLDSIQLIKNPLPRLRMVFVGSDADVSDVSVALKHIGACLVTVKAE
jgi:hypothetical protein